MQPNIELNDYFSDDKGIVYLGDYIPSYRGGSTLSRLLIDLKNKKKDAIEYFAYQPGMHNFVLDAFDMGEYGWIIFMTVPSSNKDSNETGMHLFVRYCVDQWNDFDPISADCSNALIRHTTIHKAHLGGDRSIGNHLETIQMNPRAKAVEWFLDTGGFQKHDHPNLSFDKGQLIDTMHLTKVENPAIIVVDDVTTSGNSLLACRKILFKAGFQDIFLLALLKTK